MSDRVLILGGARSGKSRRALSLAEETTDTKIMIATAEASDTEMALRIDQHREERGARWSTIEEPLHLSSVIAAEAKPGQICVVDCLTLWLSNLMHYQRDVDVEIARLVDVVHSQSSSLILVSNEVGLGLVPETVMGREFRDFQGRLNQSIAAVCDKVELMAAGLSLTIKG